MASADDLSEWESSSSDSEISSSDSEDSAISTPACASCKKTQSEIAHPLKRCAKCHSQHYCSRECQAADWKVHKRSCGGVQQNKPKGTTASGAMPRPTKDFLKGMGDDDYLHQFSEKDAFCQLIDCYRLRIEDDYTFSGDAGGLYAGDNPLPDFRRFLNLAEKRKDLLPKWWSPAKRKECERLAIRGREFSNISGAVEKSDIVEHYGDPLMPMKLRMLAETIYGRKISMGGW